MNFPSPRLKGQRKFNGRGVEDFLKAGPGQLEADDDDQRSHGQPGKVFIPGMAVGMVLVRRTLCQTEAKQGDDGAGGVGQVVHGVGGNGHGMGGQAHDELAGEQQQVAENAHNAGKNADFPP